MKEKINNVVFFFYSQAILKISNNQLLEYLWTNIKISWGFQPIQRFCSVKNIFVKRNNNKLF